MRKGKEKHQATLRTQKNRLEVGYFVSWQMQEKVTTAVVVFYPNRSVM